MVNVETTKRLHTTLTDGGLILFPTDTIWGIGCDATNPEAVEKIYALKQRPKDKPLVVIVDSIEMLRQYVASVHPKIQTLLEYHVRPLTVIYDQAVDLAPNAINQDGTVGIRLVLDPLCKSVISAFGKPLVATSANVSGLPFPKNFGEISSDIIEGVDYVVKAKQRDKNHATPSPIVRLGDDGELEFLRE